MPSADIPSILTAAGTTVAFVTVYGAYALYGFLDPTAAFLLLGAVALATLAAALVHGPWLAALGLGQPLAVLGAWHLPLSGEQLADFARAFPGLRYEVRRPTLDDLFLKLALPCAD